MGSSPASFQIVNQGFTREYLKSKLVYLRANPKYIMEDGAENYTDSHMKLEPKIDFLTNASLLPFYEEEFSHSSVESNEKPKRLSQYFGAPVISFSVFDEDILFIHYSDVERESFCDFEIDNCDDLSDLGEERDEYFPVFLKKFCAESNHKKLMEIWCNTDYDFASDKMRDMIAILVLADIESANDFSYGYEKIDGKPWE